MGCVFLSCDSWPEGPWGPLRLGQGQDLPATSHWDPARLSSQSVPSWGQDFTASPVAGKAVAVRGPSLREWVELVGNSCSSVFHSESRRVKLQGILADLRDVDGLPPKVTVPPPGTPQPRPHEGNLQPHTPVPWGP